MHYALSNDQWSMVTRDAAFTWRILDDVAQGRRTRVFTLHKELLVAASFREDYIPSTTRFDMIG